MYLEACGLLLLSVQAQLRGMIAIFRLFRGCVLTRAHVRQLSGVATPSRKGRETTRAEGMQFVLDTI